MGMNIEIELQEFLAREGGAAPGVTEPLVSSGRIDSLGLLQLLEHIAERYGIDLLGSESPERFDTIAGLALAVREAGNA